MYSTSTPRSFKASTTWSLSAFTTRGSLAPWAMNRGTWILSTWNTGEAAAIITLSVAGSPTISCIMSR